MTNRRITKRTVESIKPAENEYTAWDATLSGFGVRVRPSGAKSYVVVYRAGSGRGGRVRRYTIASVGKIAPDRARARAVAILGSVAHGLDPAGEKAAENGSPTVAELADRFMSEHVLPKRKPRTAEFYRDIFDRIVNPAFGCMKADKLTRQQVTKLHSSLHETPFQANRVLATLGSLFGFAARTGIFPTAGNPARNIDKFRENRRERFLSSLELTKLGRAIHIAETIGLPWQLEGGATLSKHLAAPEKRFSRISPFVAASLRLLLFTGCRLREILNLRWEHVDFERGLLLLPDSKSGRKTIVLNAPALSVLANLTRTGAFVISSGNPDKPRADLKAPWRSILKHAALEGLRLHDLRHTYASIGAGGGLGLPVIGKLLGHSQATTTARYAHLDNDPLRNATESIGGRIAAALEGRESGSLIRRTG